MTDDIKKFALSPPPESGKKSRHRSASSMGNIPANINIAELAAQARAQTRVDTGDSSPRAHSVTAAALTSPRAHVVAKSAAKHDRKFSNEAPAAISHHHQFSELDVPTIDNFLPGQPPPPPGPPPPYAQRYRNSSVITPSGVEQRFKPRPPPGPPPAHILAQYAPKGAPAPQPAEPAADAAIESVPAPIPEEPSEEIEGKAEQKPKIVQVDALAAMQRGATFLKCGRFGEPHFRRFQLINGNRTLQWTSDKKAASESQVHLADVDVISLGQHTPNFWRLGDRSKALEPGSFSIMHANQSKSLDLVAQDTHQLKIWSEGLAALVREIKFNTENDVSQLKALIVKLDLDNKPVSLQFLSPLPVSANSIPLIPASIALSMVASAAAKSPASPLSPRSKPPPPPGPPPPSAQRNRGHARTRSAYTGGMESIAVEVAAQVLGPKQLEKDFASSDAATDSALSAKPANVDALTPRSAASAETLQKYKLAPPPGQGTPRRTSKDKDTREAGDH